MSGRLPATSVSRHGFRRWISFAAIAGTVAGVAYLFDPREGRARRERISQRTVRLFDDMASNARLRLSRQVASPAERWPDEPPPDVDSEAAAAAREIADPNRPGRKTLVVTGGAR